MPGPFLRQDKLKARRYEQQQLLGGRTAEIFVATFEEVSLR
jgi:hypothetical protein